MRAIAIVIAIVTAIAIEGYRCKQLCHQLLHVIALAIAITSAIAAIEIMVGISHTTLQRAIAFTRIHGCTEP